MPLYRCNSSHEPKPISCPNCSHIIGFSEEPGVDTENQHFLQVNASGSERKSNDIVTNQMDAKIGQMDHLIDTLLRQRAVISQRRNQYAPIGRLPIEILSEIFRWTFRVSGQDSPSYPGPTTVPLLLGKICSHWRNIAWGLSEIWATFHCHLSRYKTLVQKTIMEEWISRSGIRLLSIHISYDNPVWDDAVDGQTHIIEALIPHCRRWESIDLTLPESWHQALAAVKGKLDNLASLKVRPSGNGFVITSLDFFSYAPLLRSITSSQYYLTDLEYPWTQLTTASFRFISIDEALEIVTRCPNLVTCRFDDLADIEGHFPMRDTPHKNIQQFIVTLNTYISITPFLDHLSLPNASFLGLILPEFYPDPLQAVHILVQRSECRLKTIQIAGVDIPSLDLIDFLKCYQGILHFNNNPFNDIEVPSIP